MRIILLSALPYIDENERLRALDDHLLQEALTKRGAEVIVLPWESVTSTRFPRGRSDVALVRSTWTYHHAPEQFVASLEEIASLMPIRNALPVMLWNMNKSCYLRDLSGAGFPIIPTIWLHSGSRRPLARVLAATGWRRAVLKPAIAANSFGTCLFTCEDEPMRVAQSHLDRFLKVGRSMMLQPYLPTVEEGREHSYVFIGGTFGHAFQKQTPFGMLSPSTSLSEPELISPPEDEIQLASCLMRWVKNRFGQEAVFFGRVDLVRDLTGEIRIMELELIEPLLHLEYAEALPRLVDLILTRGFEHASSRGQEHCEPPLAAQEGRR